MPSGRTHDSITLWSLPLVAVVTFERTQNAGLTLLLSGGYLFSGLMFGPDLDIHSRQYKRWGVLRWIWLPYRRSMRHRSLLSHGPVVGTVVRVVYLLGCLLIVLGLVGIISAIAHWATGESTKWVALTQQYGASSLEILGRSLQQHWPEWVALGIGLELGALSHTTSDWISSAYKRHFKRHQPSQIQLPPTSSPPPGFASIKSPNKSPKPKSGQRSPTVSAPPRSNTPTVRNSMADVELPPLPPRSSPNAGKGDRE